LISLPMGFTGVGKRSPPNIPTSVFIWLMCSTRNIIPMEDTEHPNTISRTNENPLISSFSPPYSPISHMVPHDVENYLRETAHVLKRGGRCLITFFLLTRESLELISAGKSTYDFKYERRGFRTIDEATPESGVAYDEEFIRGLYGESGLSIAEPIRFGSWCGRRDYLSYQDVIIAVKP
jgi:hypothetical protein